MSPGSLAVELGSLKLTAAEDDLRRHACKQRLRAIGAIQVLELALALRGDDDTDAALADQVDVLHDAVQLA